MSTTSGTESESLPIKTTDGCLATRLYSSCVTVLSGLYRQVSSHEVSHSGVEPWILGEELGRLYLCGEAFGLDEFDRVLEDAYELRDTLLEILAGIGHLLARSKFLILLSVH